MSKKQVSNTTTKPVKQRFWLIRMIDGVLTFPDVIGFFWYGIQRHIIKEEKKKEIKTAHNIRTGKYIDTNPLLGSIIADMREYRQRIPFGMRVLPTIFFTLSFVLVWYFN